MAIEFHCPHCLHRYRLKDELAGKTATCKNCREKIVIPQPTTIPDAPLSPEEIAAAEAKALAALTEEPAKAAPDAAEKVIPVECPHCNTKWTEPLTRAGKNALCPNPECKQRVKIPEAKADELLDWRQARSKLPSMAKQANEKLEGVQDAAEAKIVSGAALKQAGAIDEGIDPRPLKQKVMFVLLAVGLVAGLVLGAVYLSRTTTAGKEDRLMADAEAEFAKSVDALPKDEVPLFTAIMKMAGGEHAIRHDTKEKFTEGMDHFARAQAALRPGMSAARNAACGELAVALLALGGTEEQAREQTRIRWMPDVSLRVRPNERVFTVYEELQKALGLVQPAEFEFRAHLARRLTRDLAGRGQATLAVELIPLALFSQAEQSEAKAIVALEVYRADKASDLPRKVAEELKGFGPNLIRGQPLPASAQTLFLVLKTDKPPFVVGPLQSGGQVADGTRYAYTGLLLLEGKAAEALALANGPGTPAARLRALVLCADWAADPAPALDAAFGLLTTKQDGKTIAASPYAVLRLAQVAAAAGKFDQAKQFADQLADDSLKAWAKGDALRLRLAAVPKEKGEEEWAAVADDPKKLRAGHAWGRLWLARQNARITGDRTAGVKAVIAWPSPIVPFGKAGVALGIQDQEK